MKRPITKHGYTGYTHGCDCDVCRAAKAEYMRKRRAEATARRRSGVKIEGDFTHGTFFGYEEKGCGCWECSEAKRLKRHAEELRAKTRSEASV